METKNYSKILWYRRSSVNAVSALVGLLFFPPFLWATCILLLTGDIYTKKHNFTGNLKTWGIANKSLVVIILFLQVVGIIRLFTYV